MSYTFEKKPDQYALIVEGEYEATIEKVVEAQTPSGKKKLDLVFRLRADIEQEHQNRVVFETIWQEKDTSFYNRKRLNQLLGTQEVEDGKKFNSIQEIIDLLTGSKIRIKVIIAFDDYRKMDVNKIAYYTKTQKPNKKIETQEIKDEDLPF